MNAAPLAKKLLAVLEVILVVFAAVPLVTLGVYRLFPSFESWQTGTAGFPFAVFVYAIMVLAACAMILIRRRSFAEYGLTLRNTRYQLDIFLGCFIPVVLCDMPLSIVDYKSWPGALIMAAVNIALLVFLGWLLRAKHLPAEKSWVTAGLLVAGAGFAAQGSAMAKALVLFLTYALFVGFGEEIMYRGYMQSRLNEVFGRPFTFLGVSYGWGLVITSLLFGLTHVGVLRWILGTSTEMAWAWGFWTAFGGLVSGFIREKSGGILAPALLHGLPQALFSALLVFM